MVPIIHLTHANSEQIITHLLALDENSRRLRFGMDIPDKAVVDYVDKIHWDEDGLYGIYNHQIELVGFTHAARCNDMVEFGVSVLPKYRGRGYGTELFIKAALFARNHYINKMFMHCLRENAPMLKIARKYGMRLVTESGEVDAYLEMPPLDQSSLAEDLIREELGAFDLAVKQGVYNFDFFSKGMTSMYSSYVNAFMGKKEFREVEDDAPEENQSENASQNNIKKTTVPEK